MTSAEFIRALYAAGVRENLPITLFDREAARLLGLDERTIRRYRSGAITVPHTVRLLLAALAK